ncbi:MAG: IS630 family transposase [Bdellovibrionales bacterium]|nr:IS630 family transposase [Bdellovibrionales bacterium]
MLKQLAILAMSNDFKRKDIAVAVGVSPKTVTSIQKKYAEFGLGSVLSPVSYRPVSCLEPYRGILKASFLAECSPSVAEAAQRISHLTGLKLGQTQVRHFLKSIGMRFCKLGHIPGKADPAAQEVFWEEVMMPRIAECIADKRHVFFIDSAHFVLAPFLSFVWSFCRLFIKAPSGRQRYNVLGALHAKTKILETFRNTGYIDSTSVVSLFKLLKERYTDQPITIILDNAPYQRCKFVQETARQMEIELCFLPSYSPNLNLIERVWKIIKKSALNGRYYPTFKEFKSAIDKALDEFHEKDHRKTLNLKFQRYKKVTFMAA